MKEQRKKLRGILNSTYTDNSKFEAIDELINEQVKKALEEVEKSFIKIQDCSKYSALDQRNKTQEVINKLK